ncbi:MAG: hypothetical protein PHE21_00600 [Candidatus Dojkabacteria bacterium]|nr:hypothetical protein [Candidatus Dojkabacteria bacterium]
MGNIESSEKGINLNEIIQENADTMRLLKIGLRNHDPEIVVAAMTRISDRYGDSFAERVTFTTISTLMENEGWSFELENREPSPLI